MFEFDDVIHRSVPVIRVINALHDFFHEKHTDDNQMVYASTRDIADRSELSIYNARHILMRLEKEGVIFSVKKGKGLYWNKTENFSK